MAVAYTCNKNDNYKIHALWKKLKKKEVQITDTKTL